ncbi:MAG: hypothetical protein AABZ60_19180 [Planctomycetota bacterium]
MRFLFLCLLCVVCGCHPIEVQTQVDIASEQEVYHQLTKNYPPLESDPERSASEMAYEVARYPLLYAAGVLVYATVQASIEEGPALVSGFSGTIYGDQWIDFWNQRRLRWDVWEEKTSWKKTE